MDYDDNIEKSTWHVGEESKHVFGEKPPVLLISHCYYKFIAIVS